MTGRGEHQWGISCLFAPEAPYGAFLSTPQSLSSHPILSQPSVLLFG